MNPPPPPTLGDIFEEAATAADNESETPGVGAGFDNPESEQRDEPPPPPSPGELSIAQLTPDSLAVLETTTLDGSKQWESSCEEIEAIDTIRRRRGETERKRQMRITVNAFLNQEGAEGAEGAEAAADELTKEEVITYNALRAQASLALWTGIIPDDLKEFMKNKCGDPYPPKMCFGCNMEDVPVDRMVETLRTFSRFLAKTIGGNLDLACHRVHEFFKRAIYPHVRRADGTPIPMWRAWHIKHHLLFHSMNSQVQLWREVLRSNNRIPKLQWQAAQSNDHLPKVNTEMRAERKHLIWLLERDPDKLCFKSSEGFYDMSNVSEILGTALPKPLTEDGNVDEITI